MFQEGPSVIDADARQEHEVARERKDVPGVERQEDGRRIALRRFVDLPRNREQLRYFLPWAAALIRRSDPLADRTPWFVFSARKHVESALGEHKQIFEYGSGGSTLWFADHGCMVVTVEHDREWFNRVRGRFAAIDEARVRYLLSEPKAVVRGNEDSSMDDDSADWRYAGLSFGDYVATIDSYPEGFFDVVLVDGRARDKCLLRAWPKVRAGGLLVLDNSDRERYRAAMESLPERGRYHYFGPAAYSRWYWRTTIWKKMDP